MCLRMLSAACTAGGIAAYGLTDMAVTPSALVKCNMQIDPAKYQSISSGFGVVLKEQGARGFFRGWVPTLLGYSALAACKIGVSQFFKRYYSDIGGPEYATRLDADNMMKFASFQFGFDMICKYALPRPKEKVKIEFSREKIFGSKKDDISHPSYCSCLNAIPIQPHQRIHEPIQVNLMNSKTYRYVLPLRL
ncbi:Phosphate carrier protein [Musa troglodytarum]|uniref:Phosphate carrier protein n=1 Tax=Musa troglodytarum TaxID=320322 RepID=A0A9E7I2H3_9LILI|nr:Phosphate carrier protein [Musa troglodytarum]